MGRETREGRCCWRTGAAAPCTELGLGDQHEEMLGPVMSTGHSKVLAEPILNLALGKRNENPKSQLTANGFSLCVSSSEGKQNKTKPSLGISAWLFPVSMKIQIGEGVG